MEINVITYLACICFLFIFGKIFYIYKTFLMIDMSYKCETNNEIYMKRI